MNMLSFKIRHPERSEAIDLALRWRARPSAVEGPWPYYHFPRSQTPFGNVPCSREIPFRAIPPRWRFPVEIGNGIASASAFPNGVWERGEAELILRHCLRESAKDILPHSSREPKAQPQDDGALKQASLRFSGKALRWEDIP
jgi:hypothetical protein